MKAIFQSSNRPLVVWTYAFLAIAAWAVWAVGDSNTIGRILGDGAVTAISVSLVWRRSRIGFCIVLALSVVLLPLQYSFVGAGQWGSIFFALAALGLLSLLNPWMFRWIWPGPVAISQ